MTALYHLTPSDSVLHIQMHLGTRLQSCSAVGAAHWTPCVLLNSPLARPQTLPNAAVAEEDEPPAPQHRDCLQLLRHCLALHRAPPVGPGNLFQDRHE